MFYHHSCCAFCTLGCILCIFMRKNVQYSLQSQHHQHLLAMFVLGPDAKKRLVARLLSVVVGLQCVYQAFNQNKTKIISIMFEVFSVVFYGKAIEVEGKENCDLNF